MAKSKHPALITLPLYLTFEADSDLGKWVASMTDDERSQWATSTAEGIAKEMVKAHGVGAIFSIENQEHISIANDLGGIT